MSLEKMKLRAVVGAWGVLTLVFAAGVAVAAENIPWVYKAEDHIPVNTATVTATVSGPWAPGLTTRDSDSQVVVMTGPWAPGLTARSTSSLVASGYNLDATSAGVVIIMR